MTPRIDTMRREISEAIDLLTQTAAHLDDLHDLAYTAHRSGDNERSGTRTEWFLDDTGSPRAKELLRNVSTAIYELVNGRRLDDEHLPGLRAHLTEVTSFLTQGQGGSRKDKTADATTEEILSALEAQRRRRTRGEFSPRPLVAQPPVVAKIDWHTECEALRAAVRKTTRDFAEDHQHCQPPRDGGTRYKRQLLRRYPTKNLSQRERDAWRRATQLVADTDTAKAS